MCQCPLEISNCQDSGHDNHYFHITHRLFCGNWGCYLAVHDDVIKWKSFPRYWPFTRGINRSPVNSLHKGQWRGALMFSLICAGINGWVNSREAGDLERHRAHRDVTIMPSEFRYLSSSPWVLPRHQSLQSRDSRYFLLQMSLCAPACRSRLRHRIKT